MARISRSGAPAASARRNPVRARRRIRRIRAGRYAEIGLEVPGRIVEIPVREGDRVKAGQVLARLDARDYQTSLAAAEATRKHAATEVDRAGMPPCTPTSGRYWLTAQISA
jgi:multidrug efflux pump subunit AcrA (membrane-fusion protein)